ncbi:MAG TPA: glycoside hydrolase family 57 protein [Nitrospira sp.]|nr:glycoside hydrolase family 57 protein [Nitrospira sp.]
MKRAFVCFVWHMHQPYYTDPVAGSASMPWVRLHATKAYFDMGFLLEKHPAVKATFNFTPSLLLQLDEIGRGAVREHFLEHSQRPAEELRPEDKAFLIRHFFSANWATMVRPFPRYHELLVKRGWDVSGSQLERAVRQFTTQELLDLQVWFNLAWFGYGAIRRYPRLAALRKKNRGFTEDEKQEVLSLQLAVVREIVPLYRMLADRGQIELTTTPFYHPILPLVIDTDITQRARPDLPLPPRFRAPEDAEAQLRLAVEYHTTTFGHPPAGLWPSEGSVCPELIPLVTRVGLRWLATDEGILARSRQAAQQPWHRPADLYRPYRAAGTDVSMVFRDREISDAFGFVYHKTSADSAADDVLRRLRQVVWDAPADRVLIPIILDGENPWEHYHEGGEDFLSRLYTAFTNGALDGVQLATATMSEALQAMPPTEELTHLHSGSWINQDYKIWIGHEEDNRGWDLLGHTRSHLVERSRTLAPAQSDAAWKELYAAEGSDWFWWYGDDFDTAYKEEFDRLFRTHLRNVWTLSGARPPEVLTQPIFSLRTSPEAERVTQPRSFIHPTLDGCITDFFEWRGAGTIDPNPPLGAMWKAETFFTAIYFGWDLEHLYIRLDPDERSQNRQQDLHVDVQIQSGTNVHRVSWPLGPSDPTEYQIFRQSDGGGWEPIGKAPTIKRQTVVEVAVPFRGLLLLPGDAMQLSLIVFDHGLEAARYPHHQPAKLTVPGPEFEATMWRV